MSSHTDLFPKPLISLGNKTLLEHKFDLFPTEITEIVLVIGYKGEMIREHFGSSYNTIPITYVEDATLSGTAHALWHAQQVLSGRFLVMMGDDLYSAQAFQECARYDFSIACKKATPEEPGSRVILDTDGHPIEFITHEKHRALTESGGLIFTGLYSLTTDIFRYEPVKMKTKEEWGLPQTLMSARFEHPIKVVETDYWVSVNSPEELSRAKTVLSR